MLSLPLFLFPIEAEFPVQSAGLVRLKEVKGIEPVSYADRAAPKIRQLKRYIASGFLSVAGQATSPGAAYRMPIFVTWSSVSAGNVLGLESLGHSRLSLDKVCAPTPRALLYPGAAHTQTARVADQPAASGTSKYHPVWLVPVRKWRPLRSLVHCSQEGPDVGIRRLRFR